MRKRKGVGRDRAWWGFAPLRGFLRFEAHKTWELSLPLQERGRFGRRGSGAMTSDSAEMQAGQICRFDHTFLVPTYLTP